MRWQQRPWAVLGGSGCLAAALAATVIGVFRGPDARAQSGPRLAVAVDPAVERARAQVKMLDDLYKNAVVSITKTYVDVQDDRPAIMVAKEIFGAMQKQGWHSARLVDATGDPMNEDNSPQTDFEKEASRLIRSGKPYYDQVVGQGEERRLLAATVVPVVMKKCATCHAGKKMGEVLGFLRYDVPIK
jgi:hypothetical protein